MNTDSYKLLENVAGQRQKALVDYFNEYRELKTVSGLIKTLETRDGNETLEMVTGEQIPVDNILSVNGHFLPGYEEYEEALNARCSVTIPKK